MCDTIYHSRIISYANSAVRINCGGKREAELAQFLFQYLPEDQTCPPHTHFTLFTDVDGQMCLCHEDSLLIKSDDESIIAEKLLGDTCYHLVDKSNDGMLFHAAVVGWNNQGILFPGSSGAGKSTLTAWLLSQKFTYLSDELAFIPHRSSQEIKAFTRPLNLKQPSRHVLEPLLKQAHSEEILSNSRIWLIPPRLFSDVIPSSTIRPQLIVFPYYKKNSLFEWHKLSSAQTGLALMECLVNARNLSGHGFFEVAELARSIPAYILRYSDFGQLENHFQNVCMTLRKG